MKFAALITVMAVLLMNLVSAAHAMGVLHENSGVTIMHNHSDDHSDAAERGGDCGLGGHHHFSHWYGHAMQVADVLKSAGMQPINFAVSYHSELSSPPARPSRA
jgi:hypothetical protein